MPNRDDDKDPKRNDSRPDREGPISRNLRAFMSQRREKLRREADAILLRSTPEIIASREKHRHRLEVLAAQLLKAAHLRLTDQYHICRNINPAGLERHGMEETYAIRRPGLHRIDWDLVANFRGITRRELEKAKPDWVIVRGAFFGLAGVLLSGRDRGSAEYTLHQGYRLMQARHGQHARPVIAFAAKAVAWCLARKLYPAASRFAEALQFTLGGYLPKQDPRLVHVWMRLAECYRLAGSFDRAVAAALEAWTVVAACKGRAPDVAPLILVARLQLVLGRFKEVAEAASLVIKVAVACGFAQTEHAHDARSLLSEVT
ncbi:MAG: hypothetical protein ACO3ND_10045 [Opitutales bacterium]